MNTYITIRYLNLIWLLHKTEFCYQYWPIRGKYSCHLTNQRPVSDLCSQRTCGSCLRWARGSLSTRRRRAPRRRRWGWARGSPASCGSLCQRESGGSSQSPSPAIWNEPIRDLYSGHVTCMDQSGVSILITTNQYWPIRGQYVPSDEPPALAQVVMSHGQHVELFLNHFTLKSTLQVTFDLFSLFRSGYHF